MKKSLLVQTRIESDLHKWVAEAAKDEGLSIASFLRRLLLIEKKKRSALTVE